MNLTISLLRIIDKENTKADNTSYSRPDLLDLYRHSLLNRMPLIFLETLKKERRISAFASAYKEEYNRYLRIISAISRVSGVLAKGNVDYAIFKTTRPYISRTADIDILFFGNRSNHTKAVEVMKKAGYEAVAYGPRSTTFRDKEAHIGIDLYEQIAVSYITYIDKEKMKDFIETRILPGPSHVTTLKPEADLACIIAHSIIKEQMYTLSEYYAFTRYLEHMNVNDFVKIVEENNITSATRTHATITALLHKKACKSLPNKFKQILAIFGEENLEAKIMTKCHFETPHKYHPITIVKTLLEISKEKKSRNSIAVQLFHMTNPRFTKKFLNLLIEHTMRKAY